MNRALFKSTGVVSGMTFISRILGFVRDMVLARYFGAAAGTDAFFVAFKIPNFMRRLFAEGAFSQAFVPVFAEYQTQRSRAELQELVDRVAGTLGLILFAVTLVGVLTAPWLVYVFAPGFADEPTRYELTAQMLRITFPYLLFISLTAFAGGILNSCGRFAVPALTPVLLNVCLIAAAIWAAPLLERPVLALAWGVFLAGIVQLAFQIPYLRALQLLPRPRWGWHFPGVQRILKLMIPTLFGSSVAQINLLFDTLLASFLVAGSVSWLYYSDRLVEFPLGVFGVALGTVILPSLSQRHAAASKSGFNNTLDWALRWVLLVGSPATVGLVVLSGPLITTLFQYGEFTELDAVMAGGSLMAYALGLLAFMLIKVLAPGFYARQDTRTPVKIGIIAMVANMGFNVALIFPLAHVGLALATSLSAFLNAGLLFRGLRREGIYKALPGWPALAVRIVLSNALMGAVVWYGAGDLEAWTTADAGGRVLHLLWLVALGAAVYIASMFLLGLRIAHVKLAHDL
ncbi:MAG: murein biosynthesis integral membrane protein MurJ [Candidatus Competibacteraceae bacterium]|nr:murein biosynthesis integral membrane protein MurJ [Candidatus Competibacteraceae bacterium]